MTVPVTGIAKILTTPKPLFAILIKEADGTVVGTTTCAADGTFSFPAPATAGDYAIAFIDPQGEYRGKIVHVNVPA